jgi:hypothetical protein
VVHFSEYAMVHITNALDFYDVSIYGGNIELYVLDDTSMEKSWALTVEIMGHNRFCYPGISYVTLKFLSIFMFMIVNKGV